MSTSAFVEGWDTRWKQKFSSTSSCLFGWEIQTCYPSENNISLQAVCNVYAHNGVCRWKCKQKRPLQNQLSLLAVHLLINSHTWVYTTTHLFYSHACTNADNFDVHCRMLQIPQIPMKNKLSECAKIGETETLCGTTGWALRAFWVFRAILALCALLAHLALYRTRGQCLLFYYRI